ncbi:MAG: hypothetical protein AB1422_02380 [bacterium]
MQNYKSNFKKDFKKRVDNYTLRLIEFIDKLPKNSVSQKVGGMW